MIPAWIIEEIRRREEEREQPRVQIPLEAPRPFPFEETSPPPEDAHDRGVVVIDL